jgi:hypothetical protein
MQVERAQERCRIDSRVGQLAFAPNVRKAMERLGYNLVEVDAHDTARTPDLRIADDRHPESLPCSTLDPRTPIVLLTGASGSIHDPRVVGRVRRPAGLADLYRVVQQAVETHPRSAPRVDTKLSARIVRRDQGWPGVVMTLSERGCMAHTTEAMVQGDRVHLHFTLPEFGLIDICARVVWSRGQCAGLVFTDADHRLRSAIDHYVGDRLANRN